MITRLTVVIISTYTAISNHDVIYHEHSVVCLLYIKQMHKLINSHLLKNFPQFVVIHTVKGFGIVNKAEVDVLMELSCFFDNPMDVGNLISGS